MESLTFLANSGLPGSENGPALTNLRLFMHYRKSISPGELKASAAGGLSRAVRAALGHEELVCFNIP